MRVPFRSTSVVAITAAVVMITTACGAMPATEPTPTPSPKAVDIVIIGDSLIDPANGCGGCAGFGELFGERVGKSLKTTPRVHLVTALGVPEALTAVTDDASARKLIKGAEVVVVQTGYNNALPDPGTGIGCGGSLGSGFGPWIRSTTPACLQQGVDTYGDLYSRIFAAIHQLRGTHATAFITTSSIDGNNNDVKTDPEGLLGVVPAADRASVLQWCIDAYARWNAMLEERSTAAHFQFIDVAKAVNGEDGTGSWQPYTVDGSHPNEKGNALYAEQLSTADLTMLR